MLKIDIISGFLGAGKTTFIKKILATELSLEKIIIIENEFGQVSIDNDFLKDTNVEIKDISQGCICCSLVGDFTLALKEIIEKYKPERIIIEPSGVGKLSDIITAIAKANLKEYLNTIVCLVDANKAKLYSKNFGEFFKDQIKNANTVILSRTDIATDEKGLEAYRIIRDLNRDCLLISTPIEQLSNQNLLNTYEGIDINIDEVIDVECCCSHQHEKCEHQHHDEEECGCGHHHHDEESEHHHAQEIFMSIGIETIKKYQIEKLKTDLRDLANGMYGMVVRAKGIVFGSDNKWYHFNITPEELNIVEGKSLAIGKISVIGIDLNENIIKDLF